MSRRSRTRRAGPPDTTGVPSQQRALDRLLPVLAVSTVIFHELSLRRRVLLSQLPLTATMLFIFVFVAALHAHELPDTGFRLAMVSTAVLTIACAVVPWERLPYPSFLVIPVLDFVPITLLRDAVDDSLSGVGLLAAFPVIWLAASGQLPRVVVPLGALLTLAMVWAPLVREGRELDVGTLTGPLLIPFMMLGIGTTVQVLDRSMERQKDELRVKDAELRRLLAEGARRERLLDTVLETVDAGVLAIDADGHDVLGNGRQRRMHEAGLPPGAEDAAEADLLLFGHDGVTPIPVPDRPAARALRGESFSGELVHVGTPPGQRVYSISARAMRDREGHHDGSVLTFTDVTELSTALEAKDEFLAGVSHELRTPLTSVRGYSELLAMTEDLPEDVRSGLEVIERNAAQLLVLVEDLLSTSTAVSDLQPVPTDLVDVVAQSVATARPRAASSGVALLVEAPPSMVLVCDPVRIGQVLDNLLSNAVKYSPGGGSVTVRVGRSGDEFRCEVTDHGMGMSADDAASAFEKFFRAEDARASPIPGLGLGLTIAQRIVEQHGGALSCRSAPGEGTSFTFVLPAGGPAPAHERAPAAALRAPQGRAAPPRGGPRR